MLKHLTNQNRYANEHKHNTLIIQTTHYSLGGGRGGGGGVGTVIVASVDCLVDTFTGFKNPVNSFGCQSSPMVTS